MKKATVSNLWAVQATIKKSKEKVLCWNYKKGKTLYWTSDKIQPPPALFETKEEAKEAIKISHKSKEKMPPNLFMKVYENAVTSKPVRVKIQSLN